MPDNLLRRIAAAISTAPRCDFYHPERGEQCDGLEGCDRCIKLLTEAVAALFPPKIEVPPAARLGRLADVEAENSRLNAELMRERSRRA